MTHEHGGPEGLELLPKEGKLSDLFKSIAELKAKGKITAQEIEDSFYGYVRTRFSTIGSTAVRDIKPTYSNLTFKGSDIHFGVQIALVGGGHTNRTSILQFTPIKRMGKDAYGCRWMIRDVIELKTSLGDKTKRPRQKKAAEATEVSQLETPAAEPATEELTGEQYERRIQPREAGRANTFDFRGYVSETRADFKQGRFYRDTFVNTGLWNDRKQKGVYIAVDGINTHHTDDHFDIREPSDITSYHLHIELPPELEKNLRIKAQAETFMDFDPEENPPKRAGVFARELPFDPTNDPLASERARYVAHAIRFYLRERGHLFGLPAFIEERCIEAENLTKDELVAASDTLNPPIQWKIKEKIKLDSSKTQRKATTEEQPTEAPTAPHASEEETPPAAPNTEDASTPEDTNDAAPTPAIAEPPTETPIPPETSAEVTPHAAPRSVDTYAPKDVDVMDRGGILGVYALRSELLKQLDQPPKQLTKMGKKLSKGQQNGSFERHQKMKKEFEQKAGQDALAKLMNRYFTERLSPLIGEMERVATNYELDPENRAVIFDKIVAPLLPAEQTPEALAAWLQKMDITTLFKFSSTLAGAEHVGERLALTAVSDLRPRMQALRQAIDAEQKRRGYTL